MSSLLLLSYLIREIKIMEEKQLDMIVLELTFDASLVDLVNDKARWIT